MKIIIPKGVLLTICYIVMAGTANVMLAGYLKKYDTFYVTAVCFITATFCFLLVNIPRLPQIYLLCRTSWHNLILLNVFATVNWLAFYNALSTLDPVVVITIVNITGTIIKNITSPKYRPYLYGYGIAILILAAYSIYPHWLNKTGYVKPVIGLLLAHVSGYAIVKTIVLSKQLYQIGLRAGEVMAVRYYLLILVCVGKIIYFPSVSWALMIQDVGIIILLGSLSIVIPVYILQVAYAHATAKQILLTLSFAPLFIFVLQLVVTQVYDPSLWVALSVILASLTSVFITVS